MFPPLFATCAASPAVTALLGLSPTRLYPFEDPTQGTQKPYATWFIVGGSPENYLGKVPDIDRFIVQIDCWGSTATEARDVAQAIRDAIEPVAHITNWRGESNDTETKLYRYSFDLTWWVNR